MFEIIYHSRQGNTRKIAETISRELKVPAEDIATKGKLAKDSFVFLGSECYFRGYDRNMKNFIHNNNFNERKVALFGTSANGEGHETNAMEKDLVAKGANVVGKFYCKGKTLFFLNRNHPTLEDLADTRKFAFIITR